MFNNITTDKNKKAEQLKQLLDLVADVEKKTGGMPYTNQMHRNIKVKKICKYFILFFVKKNGYARLLSG